MRNVVLRKSSDREHKDVTIPWIFSSHPAPRYDRMLYDYVIELSKGRCSRSNKVIWQILAWEK